MPSGQAAVAGAALVICAARSHDESPVLLGRWLAPGIDAGLTPSMDPFREFFTGRNPA